MAKFQLLFFLIVYSFFTHFSVASVVGYIEKVWDIDQDLIYKNNDLSSSYFPVLYEDNLVFGSKKGIIKTLNINTQAIDKFLTIPMIVDRSLVFYGTYGSEHVVFYGKHMSSQRYVYCAVDMKEKKMQGVMLHEGPYVPFGEFAIFENQESFFVYSPKEGKTLYRQLTNFGISRPIFTQDYRRYIFQSDKNEIVDIYLPRFGASLILSPRSKRTDVLQFDSILSIDDDVMADNINGDTLYYHRKDGTIGQLNTAERKVVWERKYFRERMIIQGPYVNGNDLIYLVSYPQSFQQRESFGDMQLGKFISINKRTGQSNWVSDDLQFNNFGIVHFDKFIVSSDKDGNVLLLDIKTGEVAYSSYVGKGVVKPVAIDRYLYVMSDEKIYKFENKRFGFYLKRLFVRFRNWLI